MATVLAATLTGVAAVAAVVVAHHGPSVAGPFATLADPAGPQEVQDVLSVAFSPDGKALAAGEDHSDCTYLWHVG